MKIKCFAVILFCIMLTIFLPDLKVSANDTVKNLLINGDANDSLTGWTVTSGKWVTQKRVNSGVEIMNFRPEPATSASMYQDVAVDTYPKGTTMILSALMYSYKQSPTDIGKLTLEFLNSEKTEVLATKSVTNIETSYVSKTISLEIPEGAEFARIILSGTRKCGTNLDTYFADVCFGVKDSGYIFDLEPKEQEAELNTQVVTELTINNVTQIAAEDVYIEYDNEKLEYVGFEEVEGIKLVYANEEAGVLRFILASKGEANIVMQKKYLLKIKFKTIETGEALVDVTKGRITDGIEMEENVADELCGECTIIITKPAIPDDVNHSGEFTLLDLGIDGRNLGKDPASEELSSYNTDIVVNNAIDEEDLLQIGSYILKNPKYSFNKYK